MTQYFVRVQMFDSISTEADKAARPTIGAALQRIAQSGMMQAGGVLPSNRGGFFVLEVEELSQLYDLLGPEIYATFNTEVQPVLPLDQVGGLFQKWEQEGR